MSLDAALTDPVVRLYVGVVAAILVIAGALLTLLKYGLKKEVGGVITIYRSWLIMAPIMIGCVILGRVPFIFLIGVLSIVGFKEFARATGLYDDWWMTGIAYLGIATVTAAALWLDPGDRSAGWFGFFMAAPVFVISAILLVPILRNRVEGQLQAVSLAIVGFVYVGWMFGHLGFLANADHAYAY